MSNETTKFLKRLDATKVWLSTSPTFCHLSPLMNVLKIRIKNDLNACAGVDSNLNLYFSPDECMKLTPKQLRFVVCHELEHISRMHISNAYEVIIKINHKISNYAMDYAINRDLINSDSDEIEFKPQWLYSKKFDGMGVFEIFQYLLDNNGGEGGEGGEQMDEHFGFGETKIDPKMESDIQQALLQGENLKNFIKQSMGNQSSQSHQINVNNILKPKLDFKKCVVNLFYSRTKGKDVYSWNRLSRRSSVIGCNLPSSYALRTKDLIIAIDTSGSCFNSNFFDKVVAEVDGAIKMLKPKNVHVYYVDTDVSSYEKFTPENFSVRKMKGTGGGGTDLEVLYSRIKKDELDKTCSGIIWFTDGETNFSVNPFPNMQILWCIDGRVKAPYGVTINMLECY